MSDEQFQDFHPSQCVILQHQGGEGVRGLYIPLLRNFGYFQPVILKNVNILHLRGQDRVLKPFGHFKHVVSDHYNKCGHFLSVVAIFCGVWTFFVECGHFLWSMDIFCRVWSVVTTISVDIL